MSGYDKERNQIGIKGHNKHGFPCLLWPPQFSLIKNPLTKKSPLKIELNKQKTSGFIERRNFCCRKAKSRVYLFGRWGIDSCEAKSTEICLKI